MGAKQSSPTPSPGANGRTRAYSGSDLPSSMSAGNSTRAPAGGVRYHAYSGASGGSTSNSQPLGARARSAGVSGGSRPQSGIDIPNSGAAFSLQESPGSSPEDTGGQEGPRLLIGSLPAHLSPQLFGGFKCPVCSKFVSSEEMDLHLVLCLTKPRVTYNDWVQENGEKF